MRNAWILFALTGAAFAADMPAPHMHVDTDAKPWSNLDFNDGAGVIRFAVVTDNAGGPRWGIFGEAMDKINLLQPEFVMSIGDYIEGYEESREGLQLQWTRFLKDIDKLEVPFFFVPGNHDNGRKLWAEIYNERFGVPYYHFVYKDVLFLCLCTNDGPDNNTGIGQTQVDYVKQVIEEHPDVRWTLVFQHKPLWNEKGQETWGQIEAMLKDRNCTVFAGHTHNYLYQEKDGISFVTLATTGGGSTLRGAAYGEFDEIAWVTMTEEGPRIANLLLDGILPKDVRTPELAEKLALFRGGKAIRATAVVQNEESFSRGMSTLTISNPADTPLRVKVLMETAPGVHVEPATVDAVIPAKAEQKVDLAVIAANPIAVSEAQPVVLQWTASYDAQDNTRSIELEGVTRILIDAPHTIPVIDAPIAVDGNLTEWDDLPFVVNQPGDIYVNASAWKGVTDTAYRFGVRRSENTLYVAIRVVDDESCFDGWKYWEDFAMVAVDARAKADDDPKTAIFSLIAGPEVSEEQGAEYQMGQAPEGIERASVRTSDGFAAEFAIPLSYVNERQGGSWSHLRLNVSVSDFDEHDARDGATILHWRPDWTGPNAYAEEGVFLRGK